jgi:hypothetical protein
MKEEILDYLRIKSIKAALKEQGLQNIYDKLCQIVPDITKQYTTHRLDTEYLKTNVRAQHAFQMSVMGDVFRLIGKNREITIVDIGDSAGTHLQYIKGLHPDIKMKCLSVNMDAKVIEHIKAKGLEAVCCRAEDLISCGINADIFMSFETIEHLKDPISFLRDISKNSRCDFFVLTVPYLRRSRVGLHHIRNERKKDVDAESVHIFELCPEDWKLIFKHSGWGIVKDGVYLQYPRKRPTRFMKRYWKTNDFEGFYGAILKRDKKWCNLYNGW